MSLARYTHLIFPLAFIFLWLPKGRNKEVLVWNLQAKPETVEKVCEIVRSQLALSPDIELTPDSSFSTLGADSLDTVRPI